MTGRYLLAGLPVLFTFKAMAHKPNGSYFSIQAKIATGFGRYHAGLIYSFVSELWQGLSYLKQMLVVPS